MPSSEEESSEEEDEDMPANPNHSKAARDQAKGTSGTIGIADEVTEGVQNLTTGPSRREREVLEAAAAKERYMKLNAQGKTDEAKADLARLALIREQREAEAARRKVSPSSGCHRLLGMVKRSQAKFTDFHVNNRLRKRRERHRKRPSEPISRLRRLARRMLRLPSRRGRRNELHVLPSSRVRVHEVTSASELLIGDCTISVSLYLGFAVYYLTYLPTLPYGWLVV